METTLSPSIITKIERGALGRDWKAIAKRVEAMEGHWQLVLTTDRTDRGIQAEVRERLRSVGCRAQVVALKGLEIHQRPWTGWAVFARIPHSRRTPMGTLI